jgi:hypothetical protein
MVITCVGLCCCCLRDLKLVRLRIELLPDTTENVLLFTTRCRFSYNQIATSEMKCRLELLNNLNVKRHFAQAQSSQFIDNYG